MDFYHEPDNWLFGVCYEVVKRLDRTTAKGYNVELTDQFRPFVGRLKLKSKRTGRAKPRRLENCIDTFEVTEILQARDSGEVFYGCENIDHDFHVLENIFQAGKPDWNAALANIKGVYLISDGKNGKKYVGSAYRASGIGSRGSCSMGAGLGHTALAGILAVT